MSSEEKPSSDNIIEEKIIEKTTVQTISSKNDTKEKSNVEIIEQKHVEVLSCFLSANHMSGIIETTKVLLTNVKKSPSTIDTSSITSASIFFNSVTSAGLERANVS
ncbi:22144_t:CDS:2 [Entrophospora sp. SA101]|nr:22144_t:CDS:2 [Entrophospora sp. SA101]